MKFRYDETKNANLLATRGIGFEEIILEIKNGNLLDILEHHNQAKYPNQRVPASCKKKPLVFLA